MIRMIDTYSQIDSLFTGGTFCRGSWEAYINSICANSAQLFTEEVDEYIRSGKYTFERDFLPVINAVYRNPRLETLHDNFSAVTRDLERRIKDQFGKGLDVDIVLYLGLCSGAGWVTRVNGRDMVLLGVEKILELGWYTRDMMTGLIYHELGHVYHAQHGSLDLEQDAGCGSRAFIWQLFTEGIAMYFEQALQGNFQYYHQDKDGWTAWCDAHFQQILADFDRDLPSMTQFTQRYFGDWCDYQGHGDVGYYLGSRFVQDMAGGEPFDSLTGLNIDQVCGRYKDFVRRNQLCVLL